MWRWVGRGHGYRRSQGLEGVPVGLPRATGVVTCRQGSAGDAAVGGRVIIKPRQEHLAMAGTWGAPAAQVLPAEGLDLGSEHRISRDPGEEPLPVAVEDGGAFLIVVRVAQPEGVAEPAWAADIDKTALGCPPAVHDTARVVAGAELGPALWGLGMR